MYGILKKKKRRNHKSRQLSDIQTVKKTKQKTKTTTTTTINDKAPGGDDAVSEYIMTTNETLVNYQYAELLDLILILIVTE